MVIMGKPNESSVKSSDSTVLKPKSDYTVKKKKKYRGKKKSKETSARLPQKNEDFSSNWKNLLQKMQHESESKPKPVKRFPKKIAKQGQNLEIKPKSKPDIWFDDVDPNLLDPEDQLQSSGKSLTPQKSSLVKDKSFKGLTKILAMDCEMVGVGYGGSDSILARCSIVNHFGNCVFDKFVKPTEKVTDYRTAVSGIRPDDIKNGEDFKVVQNEVAEMLKGRILVGHSIKHDLKVLFLDHPHKMVRDTSQYPHFRAAFGGKTPSLKNLTAQMLGVKVQEGEHSSVQDAQATMRLYTMFRKQWEEDIAKKRARNAKFNQNKSPSTKQQQPGSSSLQSKLQAKSAAPTSKGRKMYQDSDSE